MEANYFIWCSSGETTLVLTDPGGETGCAGLRGGVLVSSTVAPSIGVLEGNFDSGGFCFTQ